VTVVFLRRVQIFLLTYLNGTKVKPRKRKTAGVYVESLGWLKR